MVGQMPTQAHPWLCHCVVDDVVMVDEVILITIGIQGMNYLKGIYAKCKKVAIVFC